jgi:lysozyme family protein
LNAFDFCIGVLLTLEGGYVNHPQDRGGPTKFGITQNSLAFHRRTSVSEKDVQNLTKEEAAAIYLSDFWNPIGIGKIQSKKAALIFFSHVVHTGPLTATKTLQKTLNDMGNQLFIDGIFGPKTEIALNMVKDDVLFCRKFLQSVQIYYAMVCEKKPGQVCFLRGWLNRSFALWDAVS